MNQNEENDESRGNQFALSLDEFRRMNFTDTIEYVQVSKECLAQLISESLKNHFIQLRDEMNQKEPDLKEVLTRKETSELFRVTLVTIHDWVKKGILHPYKVGNRTYFKRSELMEVMNNSNPGK